MPTTFADDARKMQAATFWRDAAPSLHLGQPVDATPWPVGDARAAELVEEQRVEGYWHVERIVPTELTQRLVTGLRELHAKRLPPVFLWMYDETWEVFARLSSVFTATMGPGYRYLPCIWTWVVPVGEDKQGWPPHRDRMRHKSVAEDGTPLTLSIWVPLTPATPHNGCMYVVPSLYSPEASALLRVQDCRALPAMPGDVLAWRQDIWHWGGRSSRKAKIPRISIGLELHRAGTPAYDRPLIDPRELPDLRARLALIGTNIRRYKSRSGVGPNLLALATELIAIAPEYAATLPKDR